MLTTSGGDCIEGLDDRDYRQHVLPFDEIAEAERQSDIAGTPATTAAIKPMSMVPVRSARQSATPAPVVHRPSLTLDNPGHFLRIRACA
jgi:hypothetical protein